MPRPFSPFPYFGAKSWLVKKLYTEIIPKIKHKTFIDVFGGSGKVVINYPIYLKEKLEKEKIRLIYNDLDKTLYAIFYSAKYKCKEFDECLKNALKDILDKGGGVKLIEQKREQIKNDEIKDVVELGVWTLIIYYAAYGGRFNGQLLIANRNGIIPLLTKRKQFTKKLHELLKYIEIWNLDYRDALKKVNSKNTLALVDPPYLNFENEYRIGEKNIAIDCLHWLQKHFRGSVIYTHNKVDVIVSLLKKYNYEIIEVKRPKQMLNTGTKDYAIEVVGIRKPINIEEKEKDILDILFSSSRSSIKSIKKKKNIIDLLFSSQNI